MATIEEAKKFFEERNFESMNAACIEIAQNDPSMAKETDWLMAKESLLLYVKYGEKYPNFNDNFTTYLKNAYEKTKTLKEFIDIEEDIYALVKQERINAVNSFIYLTKESFNNSSEFNMSAWQAYLKTKLRLKEVNADNAFIAHSEIKKFDHDDNEYESICKASKYHDARKDEEITKIIRSALLSAASDIFESAKDVYERNSPCATENSRKKLTKYVLSTTFHMPLVIDEAMPEKDEDEKEQHIACLKKLAEIKDWILKTRLFAETGQVFSLISGNTRLEMISELKGLYNQILEMDSTFSAPMLPDLAGVNINPSNRPQYSTSSSSGGCYVATAVYGSYDCPQVWTLRRFRDYTLAETWYGRLFIRTYYAISPTLVKWFGNTEWFKKMWKGTLDKMVNNLNAEGVEDTPYEDKIWR